MGLQSELQQKTGPQSEQPKRGAQSELQQHMKYSLMCPQSQLPGGGI